MLNVGTYALNKFNRLQLEMKIQIEAVEQQGCGAGLWGRDAEHVVGQPQGGSPGLRSRAEQG